MSPKTKEQFEGIRQEKHDLILSTALEVFATHGYHGASISTIATHAGIAKGLMYSYFESKEALLKAILEKGVQDILNVFKHIIGKEITPEIFKEILNLFFVQLKENEAFWRLYFAIAMQPNVMEMLEKEFASFMNPYMDVLQKYYQSLGSKNPKADALIAHALIDGITLNFVMVHQDFDMEKVKQIVIERLEKPSYL
jgi:AcrR family transcriptional regulator